MNDLAETVLIPPRPNLGPEPLTATRQELPPVWLGLGFFLTVLALLLFWFWRRRRDRRRASPSPLLLPQQNDESEREQMIAWSVAVREALAQRYGSIWKSRTTEEIASDPDLLERLGSERSARLVRLLREADRAKFADSSAPLSHFDFDGLAEFVTGTESAAGAKSKINGA